MCTVYNIHFKNIYYPFRSQYSEQSDVDELVRKVTTKVLESLTAHVDDEYGRLKKRVRKCDGQLSDVKMTVNSTQTQLTTLVTNLTRTVIDLRNEDKNYQADAQNQMKGLIFVYYHTVTVLFFRNNSEHNPIATVNF